MIFSKKETTGTQWFFFVDFILIFIGYLLGCYVRNWKSNRR